jgi:phenylpropionate dioxygenase-like ring-hydroxylating dioxygenase large terminal subunit
MFPRNQWYCCALNHELGREPLGRILLNEPVVIFRTEKGDLAALEDRCCHRRAPLSKGKIEGANLRCGYHGFVYDTSGRCIWVPGQDRVPPGAQVRTYPIVERHGFVWIWMGDPILADPNKAPAFSWNDDPKWASTTGYMHMRCHYQLLVDNLLDMSHLPFLHINTIGSARDLNAKLTWERGTYSLRGVRIAPGLTASPRQRAEGIDFDTDRMQIMTYVPPGNVVIEVIVTEAGKAHRDPTSRYDTTVMVLDAMTPETATTCHYFYGLSRDYALQDDALTEMAAKSLLVTFGEDKDMLEAEQRIIDLAPDAPQVDVIGDHGSVQARRIVERLLADERDECAAAE